MYEASWEWLETRVGRDAMPAARAYVEFCIDQRQPVGREGPRNVSREDDRAEILEHLCRGFDTDFDDPESSSDPAYHLFMMIYDRLACATDTFKALCLVQKGVWIKIPDNFLELTQRDENVWEDPWCWERLKKFNLLTPDNSLLGGYRITHEKFLDYGTLMARFFWEVPVPDHLLPASTKKKKKVSSENLTLALLSKTTIKHCYKFDEWCLFCAQGKEGMIHRLTLDEIEVYPCKFSGKVAGDHIEKQGFVCVEHLEKARQDPSLTVTEAK